MTDVRLMLYLVKSANQKKRITAELNISLKESANQRQTCRLWVHPCSIKLLKQCNGKGTILYDNMLKTHL